jgi:hypothetical protein
MLPWHRSFIVAAESAPGETVGMDDALWPISGLPARSSRDPPTSLDRARTIDNVIKTSRSQLLCEPILGVAHGPAFRIRLDRERRLGVTFE